MLDSAGSAGHLCHQAHITHIVSVYVQVVLVSPPVRMLVWEGDLTCFSEVLALLPVSIPSNSGPCVHDKARAAGALHQPVQHLAGNVICLFENLCGMVRGWWESSCFVQLVYYCYEGSAMKAGWIHSPELNHATTSSHEMCADCEIWGICKPSSTVKGYMMWAAMNKVLDDEVRCATPWPLSVQLA